MQIELSMRQSQRQSAISFIEHSIFTGSFDLEDYDSLELKELFDIGRESSVGIDRRIGNV